MPRVVPECSMRERTAATTRHLSQVPVTLGSPRSTSREVGGFLVTEAHFPPALTLPLHIHARATIALMLEGSFDCVLPGKVLSCTPGALHTEPAEAPHGNRIGNYGARVVVIQPDGHAVGVLGRDTQLVDQVQYVPQSGVTALGWRLARELHQADSAASLATEGLVLEFLAGALRGVEDECSTGASPIWLRQAREYLHAHFAHSIQIRDLARELDVSPVRLARRFRRRHGVSIGTYVRRLRLEWARIELISGADSLAGIAARAGFADQSHFTRAFRQDTGMTPKRFRESTGR
jgi:AraC family transcriptional regulator